MTDNEWTCPICQHKIPMGEAHYYAYGNDANIQKLQGDVEALNSALTHVIVKHLLEVKS